MKQAGSAGAQQPQAEAVLAKLALVALPLLSRRDLAQAVEDHAVTLLDLDPDLFRRRLTIALESIPRQRRDTLKQAILQRLRQSNTTLTSGALTFGNRTVVPTVGNWVQAYTAAPEQSPERFLASVPNVATFTDADRQRVAGLVELIRLFQASSVELEGLEEDIPIKQVSGRIGVIEHGRVEPLPQPASAPLPVYPVTPRTRAETPHFAAEDKHEIASHSQRLSSMALTPSSTDQLADVIIIRLTQQHGLQFSDEVLTRRFQTAMRAHLKGIRSSRDTLDVLTRSPKVGGLGLKPEQAKPLLAAAEQAAPQLHDVQGVSSLEALRRAQAQAAVPSSPRPAPPPAVSPQPTVVTPPRPAPIPSPRQRPNAASTTPVSATKRIAQSTVRLTQARPTVGAGSRIADIRGPRERRPKTMGPVDELRALTLDEFRSGGANTDTAVMKLKERFGALGREAYALRVQGMLGWRASPLYHLYLSVGSESMNARQPIRTVVQNRSQRGEPTLTVDEFHAIADLNRSLRF